EATYTTDHVNINQHQEETKEAEIQYKDISESQSDGSIQGEEGQREGVPSNQNDNDSDIEEKSEETQPKKGFWSRLFGGELYYNNRLKRLYLLKKALQVKDLVALLFISSELLIIIDYVNKC